MQTNPDRTSSSPFRGFMAAFILVHALLSFGLITKGLISLIAYLKAGNYLGLVMLGFFFLPTSLILFLKRNKLFRAFYLLYTAFFFIGNLDPANIANSLLASLLTTAIIALPWVIYIYKSERVRCWLDGEDYEKRIDASAAFEDEEKKETDN